MDVKALAKSKRAHSSHHSNKNQHSRPASRQARASKALPSNWAHYDEEDEFDQPHGTTDNPTIPKSKGADYAFLISEAKAQTHTAQLPHDIDQGLAPLLSMRGQGILSWMLDDDFDLKDEATGTCEAPFLSLDLNALAEQIAKANLAERLFIEPDLLPPEMYAEWQESNQKKFDEDKVRSDDEVPVVVSKEQIDTVEGNEVFCELLDTKSSDAMASKKYFGGWEDHVKDNDNEVEQTSKRNLTKSTAELDMVSVAQKPSKFEALTSEAELDMLLDSFNGSKFLESNIAEKMLEDVPSVDLVKKVPDMVKSPELSIKFNDDIDELLKETSTSTSINVQSPSDEVNAAPKNFFLDPDRNPASKSDLLDDFDSWLDTI